MAKDPTAKKKLPRTADELIQVEDRLEKLRAFFRDIRNGMREAQMPTVDLTLGTFNHLLGLMEPMAEGFDGDFRKQRAVKAAKDLQDRKRQQVTESMKNRTRK